MRPHEADDNTTRELVREKTHQAALCAAARASLLRYTSGLFVRVLTADFSMNNLVQRPSDRLMKNGISIRFKYVHLHICDACWSIIGGRRLWAGGVGRQAWGADDTHVYTLITKVHLSAVPYTSLREFLYSIPLNTKGLAL